VGNAQAGRILPLWFDNTILLATLIAAITEKGVC
jgi:hypothetical protein